MEDERLDCVKVVLICAEMSLVPAKKDECGYNWVERCRGESVETDGAETCRDGRT